MVSTCCGLTGSPRKIRPNVWYLWMWSDLKIESLQMYSSYQIKMSSYSLEWAFLQWLVSFKKKKKKKGNLNTETHTERKTSCDDEGRDWSNAGTPRIASNHSKLGRRKTGSFPRDSRESRALLTLDFRLQTSRIVREVCVCACSVMANSLQPNGL